MPNPSKTKPVGRPKNTGKKTATNTESNDEFDDVMCGKCDTSLHARPPQDSTEISDATENSTLQCEVCERWFHIECAEVSPRKYEVICEFNVHWYCINCDGASKALHLKVLALQTDNTQLRSDLNSLKADVKKIEKSKITKDECKQLINESTRAERETIKQELKAEMKAELMTMMKGDIKAQVTQEIKTKVEEDIRAEINQPPEENDEEPSLWSTVVSRGARRSNTAEREKEMADYWSERDRIERRKLNLIAQNVSEPTAADDDLTKLKTLIRHKLGITDEIIITDTTRLGNRTLGKNRMLRFTLQTLNMKKAILRKATTLRHVEEGDEFHNVYIQPDRTPNQVTASKNLKALLKKEREKNPTKFFKIIKGKIVEVNESGDTII